MSGKNDGEENLGLNLGTGDERADWIRSHYPAYCRTVAEPYELFGLKE
jgi:hypothetical protein